RVPALAARTRGPVGPHSLRRSRAVHGRGVRARNPAGMASRRAELRDRRRSLARVAVPDASPSLPAREAHAAAVPRADPRAALRVRVPRRRALAMAARDLADQGAALLDHVPHAPGSDLTGDGHPIAALTRRREVEHAPAAS